MELLMKNLIIKPLKVINKSTLNIVDKKVCIQHKDSDTVKARNHSAGAAV